MTGNGKKKSTFSGGRTITVALSLCLLAVITMIGMYAVGRTDQEQQNLEQKIAETEQQAELAKREPEEIQEEPQEEPEDETEAQEAASTSAKRRWEGTNQNKVVVNDAELESDFIAEDPELEENLIIEEMPLDFAEEELSEEPTLSFSPDTDKLLWPVAGNVILDYSMDRSVYFSTLDQYKYNPAIIIQGNEDESVMCSAQGRVETIETVEETGTTVTLDIGDGYELIYGQLKELPVKEGDYLKAGETIGYISEPTKYFAKEGCNVYLEVRKDGESIDPMTLLQ